MLVLGAFGSAQCAIDWHTIDGGVYQVSGTLGQLDAGGPMTNGQYSVTGGFWALPTAIQVTGAPKLTIVPATPGNATISWTPNTAGFVLQWCRCRLHGARPISFCLLSPDMVAIIRLHHF